MRGSAQAEGLPLVAADSRGDRPGSSLAPWRHPAGMRSGLDPGRAPIERIGGGEGRPGGETRDASAESRRQTCRITASCAGWTPSVSVVSSAASRRSASSMNSTAASVGRTACVCPATQVSIPAAQCGRAHRRRPRRGRPPDRRPARRRHGCAS